MPYYSWSGITIQGSIVRGSSFASTEQILENRLFQRNIALLKCKNKRIFYILPISGQQKVELFEQLSMLLASGIPLMQALILVCQQLSDIRMASTVEKLADLVRQGNQLHEAMAYYSQIFSPEMMHMIQVGAQAGNLPLALTALSDHVRAQQQLKKQLQTALIVPAVTALFFVLIFMITIFALVPRFAELFTSMNKPLPRLTQLLFSLHNLLASNFAYIGLFAVLLMLLVGIYVWRLPAIKDYIDRFILRVPLLGKLVEDIALLQLFRSLSLLHEGGMSIVQALEISVYAVDNTCVRAELSQILEDIRAGHRLSNALQGILSDRQEAILLISIGEEAGSLPIMVKKVTALYEERVYKKLRHYTLMVQPICMIILGIFVALLIIAVYMPLFDLADLL